MTTISGAVPSNERLRVVDEGVVVVGVPDAAGPPMIAAGDGIVIDDTTTPGTSVISAPAELPAYTVADAGKVLRVAVDGTLEWVVIP